MKLEKLIMICIVLNILYSCSDKSGKDHNYYEYYKDNSLKSYGDTLQGGVLDGIYHEYYKDGMIHYINNYKNGNLNGRCLEYYENGNPKNDMLYENSNPIGVQYVYYEEDSAKINYKLLLTTNKDKQVLIAKEEFDKYGNKTKEYSRVITIIPKDTFVIGEKFEVFFKLGFPEFKTNRIHIGNFDRTFKLIDSTNYYSKKMSGNENKVILTASKLGLNNIRGYMEDFYVDSSNDSTYSEIGTMNNWFDIDFFIKER